jgi:hypothetical protein
MHNTPEVESFQNNYYFEHSSSITAGHYYHQNNYHKQFTPPKIVKPVPINQSCSKASVKIGNTTL